MAVFGIPAVHEDDALRAVRAAVEARAALAALNSELEAESGARIFAHIGIETGEVVVGERSDRQALITGACEVLSPCLPALSTLTSSVVLVCVSRTNTSS